MILCRGCGAAYDDVQHGGLRYFHQCPPLSDREVAHAIGVDPDPEKQTPDDRAAMAAASRVRPNARNENPPAPAPLTALVDGELVQRPVADWRAENARRDHELTAPGAGITRQDAMQTQPADVQVTPLPQSTDTPQPSE